MPNMRSAAFDSDRFAKSSLRTNQNLNEPSASSPPDELDVAKFVLLVED